MKILNFEAKINLELFFVFFIFSVALFYRLYGLSTNNPPFWVDEFASANQGKLFLQQGLAAFFNPNIVLEHYNVTTHLLIALSYKLFGVNEFSARLTLVIVGSLIPLFVFFLTKYLTNISTAISASLLVTFSYFEITWSRQARGYIIVQFLILASLFLYLKLINLKKPQPLLSLVFLLTIFLGIITHPLYYIFLISIFFHFLLTGYKRIFELLKKPWFYLIFFFLISIIYKIGFINAFIRVFSLKMFLSSNFWYYHSFLWREYGLVTFLAIIGLLTGLIKKQKGFALITIFLITQLIFLTFIFKPYVSRYLLPIFPFLYILMSYGLWQFLQNLPSHHDRIKMAASVLLSLFIIANGYKFVNKPKTYYSLNHDFREIANIDYHQVYSIIKKGVNLEKNQAVVIETWWDRGHWYLDDFKNIVAFRWPGNGFVNGIPKTTNYTLNDQGEKILRGGALRLVLEERDLLLYLKKYPKGFLFIDDFSLPEDVRNYAERNLKKELYLDHYPLDDNPYSIWPATLYSWGIN